MKTQWLLLAAVCIVLAGSAAAQVTPIHKLTVAVPFDFVVNGITLPKGEYVVSGFADGRRVITIQNDSHSEYIAYALFNFISLGEYIDNGKMIFIRNNGQHVLHQIVFRGEDHIHDIFHQGNDAIDLAAVR